MHRLQLGCGLWALLVPLGCGEAPRLPSLYPAVGRIYLNGVPVRYGRVHLQPIDPGRGVTCWGNIGPDGTFTLRTFTDDDGAAAGDYNVFAHRLSPGRPPN